MYDIFTGSSNRMDQVRRAEADPVEVIVLSCGNRELLQNLGDLGVLPISVNTTDRLRDPEQRDRRLVLVDLNDFEDLALVVGDLRRIIPEAYVVAVAESPTPARVVHAMKCGASDFVTTPLNRVRLEELISASGARRTKTCEEISAAPTPDAPPDASLASLAAFHGPVMLYGERAVGKARLAESIHQKSARAGAPYIRFRCAKLAPYCPEHVLFGYLRGAIVGAFEAREGKLKEVGEGTLVLEEITALDLGLQAKLARVIRSGEFTPVGDTRPIPFRARVIGTVTGNPRTLVAEGALLPELAHLFETCSILLSPLRARRDQLLPLTRKLIAELIGPHSGILLTQELSSAILDYHWPGNLSELIEVIGHLADTRNSRYVAEQLRAAIVRSPQLAARGVVAAAQMKPRVWTAGAPAV